jgi:serine protease Do
VFGPTGFGNPSLYSKKIDTRDRADAIAKYLVGRDLASVEGVWIWQDSSYEVAITRNSFDGYPEYQYIGIVTDAQKEDWERGEVKLLLKETASPEVFSGHYIMGDRQKYGTLFVVTSPNVIELNVPTGPYGSIQRLLLVRAYPKGGTSPEKISTEFSRGSGFFVSRDIVATNFHVVKDAKQIKVLLGETAVQAELLLKDSQNDIALLRLKAQAEVESAAITILKGTKCLTLGNSDSVRAGDSVYTIGFPLAGVLASSASVGQGVVSNAAGLDNDPRMFQISIPIQAGNSGSPLFDSFGRVVGIVTSTLNNSVLFKATGTLSQNVNFAIKSSYLRSILALIPSGQCLEEAVEHSQPLTARDIQERFSKSVVAIKATR